MSERFITLTMDSKVPGNHNARRLVVRPEDVRTIEEGDGFRRVYYNGTSALVKESLDEILTMIREGQPVQKSAEKKSDAQPETPTIQRSQLPGRLRLYNVKEASEALGIKENTLRVWIANRKIPYTKVGRAVRFSEEQLWQAVEERKPREEEKAAEDIKSLGFCIRTSNCLHNAGMHTVEDLTAATRNEVAKVRNMGKHGLKEIEDALAARGLSFKPEEETAK